MEYKHLTELLQKYDKVSAILIYVIQGWIHTRTKKKQIQTDGKVWSGYLSHKELSKQTNTSIPTVQRKMKKLVKDGVLVVGNFNKDSYDKTRWYNIDYVVINSKPTDHSDMGSHINLIPPTYQNDSKGHIKMIETIPIVSSTVSPKVETIMHNTGIENKFYKQWLNAENNDTKKLCLNHLNKVVAGGRTKKNSKDYQSILEGIQLIEQELKTV